MAEALALVSLVSAIVQFVDFGTKVLGRLNDFEAAVHDVPKAFRDIKTELPLLLDTLKRTKSQAEGGQVTKDTQRALIPVVDGCRSQVELLEITLCKILPATGERSWKRGMKAFLSISQEKKIQQITTTLRNYVQTLTYHQATSFTALSPKTKKPSFMVPFERDLKFVGRTEIITQIGQKLKIQRRVALAGIGGVG
jgi:hypothetical protein